MSLTLEGMQNQILDWNNQANSDRTLLQVAKKLLEEASECHVAAKEIDSDRIGVLREAADVAILCFVIANIVGFPLESAIEEKLIVLRRRMTEQRQRDLERGID